MVEGGVDRFKLFMTLFLPDFHPVVNPQATPRVDWDYSPYTRPLSPPPPYPTPEQEALYIHTVSRVAFPTYRVWKGAGGISV